MKRKRRLSGVLLIIAALIIMQLPLSEADAATSASDFKMEGTTLVKYRGTDTNVSIPDTVEIIGESAFEDNDKVELVVVPKSVKRIESYAFWGCDKLDTVVLGSGIKEIGDYTFANCKGLKQITVPTNVRNIGILAFVDCVNLTDITIPPEVTSIHDTAFDGCNKLYIHCEAGSVADKYATDFYEKQKEMPEYEDVPDYQPSNETEEKVEGDRGDEEIASPTSDSGTGGNLLGSTQIVGNRAVVFIDNTSPMVMDGSREETNSGISDEDPLVNTLQSGGQGALPKYTIVDGKIVADQAYYKNSTLGQIVLPEGIEEIGQFSFARSSVTEIMIPEGVKDICYGAFYHCDNLKEIQLPTTIESVEPKAFSHSLWVENFIDNGSGDYLISGNVLVAYRGNQENIVIPEGVSVIAGEAFMGNTQLKSVMFPDSLLTIGEGTFEGCSSLTDIKLGAQLRWIQDRAFAGCPIREVTLPESLNKIGLKVFDESVNVAYAGEAPKTTHATSAERLSNEQYRNLTKDDGTEAGVVVTGVESALASLEGANRRYTLSVSSVEDGTVMQKAYQRCYQKELPENIALYDLQLTDNSGIPLTKLGKQVLTVTLPVPNVFLQENVIVYTLDRNGQLEKVEAERVLLDGFDAVRFQTTHLSLFGICGDGSSYDAENILEVSTSIQSMSAPSGGENNVALGGRYLLCLKWTVSIILLLAGTVIVLRRGTSKKN